MLAVVLIALAQPPANPHPEDWVKDEHQYLHNVKQVTTGFVRAGEGYFSPDGKRIIYQAEEANTGNPFYQIFVQDLASGSKRRISPGAGRTTCGFFHPLDPNRVIFASGHTHPKLQEEYATELATRAEEKAKKTRRRYIWDFDPTIKIYQADADGGSLKCLTPDATTYTAEGSYSPDGKQIVFSQGPAGNVQLYIMNADGTGKRQLTNAPNCYNGGPFFSADGKRVVFRADRQEKDRLQLYVINTDGTGEKQLTNNPKWVYWAPYWHPDNKHLVYTAADHGDETKRPNYDVYWLNVETGKTTRLTFAPGADVLPVFDPSGKRLMWTSSRGPNRSSQLWLADFTPPTE